jgi:hypothetical protein
MNNQTHYEVKCPHPDCYATAQLSYAKPSGIYDCKCHACVIRLSWDTYADGRRVPRLTIVKKDEVTA